MSPPDLNWQMTGFFLLALVLMGFVMKLVALFLPVTASSNHAGIFWLLLSPNALRRLQAVVAPRHVVFQPMLWFVAVLVGYSIHWWLTGVIHLRGLLLSYAALPVLALLPRALVAPCGQLLPTLHSRLWLTRSLADSWGRR